MMFSQLDSTEIYYKYISDDDLETVCELSEIQVIKIFSKDTLLRGKVFNFIIKEFKKGKAVSERDFKITSEGKQIPFVVNGDTMIYVIDMINKAGYDDNTDSLLVSFAGKLDDKKFKLKIDFPGMAINEELKGKKDYSLRTANSCADDKIKVPLNSPYPVLAYTPPFDTGSGLRSWCMLGDEDVKDWYEKFKVKHYYIIYIEIK